VTQLDFISERALLINDTACLHYGHSLNKLVTQLDYNSDRD